MFEQIIGNAKIKQILSTYIENRNPSSSYLFLGKEGIGKKKFAYEFAREVLCLDNNTIPCNKCKSCIKFNSENHPDFTIIEPDGKAIKIEQIRNMQEKVLEKPIISSHKIYIIDDSDTMTIESQNALLKTLEEPPEFVTIILIARSETKLLNTIKSRCVILPFEEIGKEDLKKYLISKGNSTITEDMLLMCEGSIKKANEIEENMRNIFRTSEIS